MIRQRYTVCAVAGLAMGMLMATSCGGARADNYSNEGIESNYITQCSMSSANYTVSSGLSTASPGFGAFNNWRIGNGAADSVDCGTSAFGSIGLLYGYHRLSSTGHSNSDLDRKAKAALSAYFWSWVRNGSNQVSQSGGGVTRTGFPATAAYNSSGGITAMGEGSQAVTAMTLIAMRKYCLLSPNADGANYQSQEYGLAHQMANYINNNITGWTVDRSYAVAAFRGFANWATAVGDSGTASYFNGQASTIAGWLPQARDTGGWHTYFDYLSGSTGFYNNNNVDQTGFSPYEFDALPGTDGYAPSVATWWDYGQAFNNDYLTQQSGAYSGGVHQSVPSLATRCYPGDSFQLADAEWKIANDDGNQNNQYAQAWWHYNFALSAIGSSSGSGCWVNNGSVDGFVGGFIDWVDSGNGSRPASWQRFIDTSGYMIVATEELGFSSKVDWSN